MCIRDRLYAGHRAGDGGDRRLVRDGARLGSARRAVLLPHGERPLAVEVPAGEGLNAGNLIRLPDKRHFLRKVRNYSANDSFY